MNVIELNNAWLKFNIQFIHQRMTMRRYLIQKYQYLRARSRRSGPGETHAASDFWALKGISLSVADGEVVGLLGHNGAGKSTLLMTMAGIYAPDRGSVRVQGQIGTLLSLGAGFHNDLSGRENIKLNAVFMGCTRQEIQQKTEQIIEYAELGEFINAPLKTYSSGMRARLGFSIAITINPDVLLIDEVFEAGDESFKKKSGNLIERYKEAGKTIVMSSHNLHMIQRFCPRSVLLDHGRIVADGPTAEIIEKYKESITPKAAV